MSHECDWKPFEVRPIFCTSISGAPNNSSLPEAKAHESESNPTETGYGSSMIFKQKPKQSGKNIASANITRSSSTQFPATQTTNKTSRIESHPTAINYNGYDEQRREDYHQ
ncbi:unnamed protein product [Linum trigynum]|uniref:Uncharacterized protein n=1 Tax=Linum trigynum TaxID=586398 RepID=A0AAV2FCW9_9ROSI